MIVQMAGGPFQILIIEDSPGDVALLQFSLRNAGVQFEVKVIDDGAEAMAYFQHYDSIIDGKLPQLLILDLNLPKHDGFEIIEAIRQDSRFESLPIAFFSSTTSTSERARMMTFGVKGALTKPPDLDGYVRIGFELKSMLGGNDTCSLA